MAKIVWNNLDDAPKDGTTPVRLRINSIGSFRTRTVKARWNLGKTVDPESQWFNPCWTDMSGMQMYRYPVDWRPWNNA